MTEASLHSALRTARARAGRNIAAVTPGPQADEILLAHMPECLERVVEYTGGQRSNCTDSRLVQDAVIRNLQTLAESNQPLSSTIKAAKPQIPGRESSGFRNAIVHGYLGIDIPAV